MYDFLPKEDMGLTTMNLNIKNPSNFLTSRIKKMACGILSNESGKILYNGNPIDGIQGAVIAGGNIFSISDEMSEKWELKFNDSGDFSFEICNGRENVGFSSHNEDNMQIFLNYGFGGREVLIVLDTRINRQGCIVNKGPKFAEQIETLFATVIQYYIAAEEHGNAANNDTALPPPRPEMLKTQENTYVESDFNHERF